MAADEVDKAETARLPFFLENEANHEVDPDDVDGGGELGVDGGKGGRDDMDGGGPAEESGAVEGTVDSPAEDVGAASRLVISFSD